MSTFATYPEGTEFSGRLGATAAESDPAWPAKPRSTGAPNVLLIVLDDVGFAQLGCFGGLGGLVETPNIDRLAAKGARFNNFHATPMCSPTRAALLTGRNSHTVGVGTIMEYASGFPGYNSRIPSSAAMVPEALKGAGYSTMALGKWHLTPDEENGPWGPFDRWPLGQGFERFYGFLPGETSQWEPELWQDNTRLDDHAYGPDDHLSEDLVDHAIEWIDTQQVVSPSKPFFTYLAFGAAHAPHHAPRRWIEHYRGRFADGWCRIREQTLEHQVEQGIVPAGTALPDHNPKVERWDDLGSDERRLLERQMEVYAAFVSHTDEQIGRVLDLIERRGIDDDTVVLLMSDNGASAEGGAHGLLNEMSYFNRRPESVQDMLDHIDEWGSKDSHPHYAAGWAEAGNTPNRWYKINTHEGGTRVPMILSWPGRTRAGSVVEDFCHVVDVVPTLLDGLGRQFPASVKGHAQMPLEGTSFMASLSGETVTPRPSQYFECTGHRALWRDGWKAVAVHWSTTHAYRIGALDAKTDDGNWDADEWELYHVAQDFSETTDLSAEHPDLLEELVSEWWRLAERYSVLPLDDRGPVRMNLERPKEFEQRDGYVYTSSMSLGRSSSPSLVNRSFCLRAQFECPEGGQGVVFAYGAGLGGFTLYVKDGAVHFGANYLGRDYVECSAPITTGFVDVDVVFSASGEDSGSVRGAVAGGSVFDMDVAATNPVVFAVGQGVQIGADTLSPVSPHYASPFAFTGEIHAVTLSFPDEDTRAQVAHVVEYVQ